MIVRPGDIVLSTCSNLPVEMRGVAPLRIVAPDGADNYTALPVHGVKPYSIGAKSIIYLFPDTTAEQKESLPYSFPMTWRTTPLSDGQVVVADPSSATQVTGNFRGAHDGKAVVVVNGYQRYFPIRAEHIMQSSGFLCYCLLRRCMDSRRHFGPARSLCQCSQSSHHWYCHKQ